jgi:hypothetical protein
MRPPFALDSGATAEGRALRWRELQPIDRKLRSRRRAAAVAAALALVALCGGGEWRRARAGVASRPAARKTCVAAAISEKAMARLSARLTYPSFEPRLRDAELQDHAEHTGTQPLLAVPLDSRRAIALLADFVRNNSACAAGEALMLMCPEHARLVGFELALLAQSVRQASLVRASGFCNSTFLSLVGWGQRYHNTPGAMLQALEELVRQAKALALPFGLVPDRLLAFEKSPVPFDVFGRAFFEFLFGFLLEQPCAAEVEAQCGVALAGHTFTIRHTDARGRPPTAAQLAAVAALRPPIVVEVAPWKEAFSRFEKELQTDSLARLSAQYRRMRKIVPLAPLDAPLDAAGARVVSVGLHVRAGSGSKSFPEAAFVPVLDELAASFRGWAGARACVPHIHVYHEYADGRCCDRLAAWAAASGVRGLVLKVELDIRRALMWDALGQADVLIAGESKLAHVVGQLSERTAFFLDGSAMSVRTNRAARFVWKPCGRAFRKRDRHLCEERPWPTLGIDANELGRLRETIATLCAAETPPRAAAATGAVARAASAGPAPLTPLAVAVARNATPAARTPSVKPDSRS